MSQLSSFSFISLDGYYKDLDDDISWHRHGEEEAEYSRQGLETGNILLFGRKTYDMMAGYWPSPMAIENDPVVADGMNKATKLVFSGTLKRAEWNNTRVSRDLLGEVSRLKNEGRNMTLLGSGTILRQLAEAGLIDTYQIMIDPVAIGSGVSLFSGIKPKLDLELINSISFKSGTLLLTYQPHKN